jgi:hypothetical protein
MDPLTSTTATRTAAPHAMAAGDGRTGWTGTMALFGRKRRGSTGGDGTLRGASKEDVRHLDEFAASRRGVEAFVEPRTAVTETTLLLVAGDGEWTRRRIDGEQGAWDFARKRSIPVYDVGIVGYPQRMREWNARRKAAGEAGGPSPATGS